MATTAIAKDGEKDYTNLQIALGGIRKGLTTMLGTPEQTEGFLVQILNMARQTPALHECTVESIQLNCIQMVSLGLNPCIPNEVFLIPRNVKQ